MDVNNGGDVPASNKSTFTENSSDNLAAITLPADPPPTKQKNKS